MGKFSKKLLNQLSEFLVCEIGSKAIDGITYTMLLNNNKKDAERLNRYNEIRSEIINCGFSSDEILRCYEVNNGCIFDMDINTAKQISIELSKAVANANNNATPVGDFIGDSPDQRRKKDMYAFSRFIKEAYDNGYKEVTAALFNKNSTNRIMVTGLDKGGNKVAVSYKAFAIRPWDIKFINSKILMKAGIRIEDVQACEILPFKTGVSFKFTIGPYNVNDEIARRRNFEN